ncbi:MAG: hypothetical protein ACRBBW_16545 [Cellvibrionaceae bacterium]
MKTAITSAQEIPAWSNREVLQRLAMALLWLGAHRHGCSLGPTSFNRLVDIGAPLDF